MESAIKTNIEKRVYFGGGVIILAVALLTALLQTLFAMSVPVTIALLVVMALTLLVFLFFTFKGKITDENRILLMIFLGMLLRAHFVLTHDIYTLQNDTGTFTGAGTDQINIGHLGYIEYLYKFGKFPDFDPYEVFGYFHPPVHHILEALWLTVQRSIGVNELAAFENLQILTLIYSGLCMLVMLHILEECGVKKELLTYGMILFCFYPRMMVLAGSVNNDILALLLLMTTIWRVLVWIRNKTYGNAALMALSLGFSMITKLNTAICAFSIGLVLLVYLIGVIRDGNLVAIRKTIWQYVVFAVISIPIGLSYILRNLILFGKKPGLPTQGEGSPMYFGDYPIWSIIGVPAFSDLHIEFPFHPISGDACHNAWVILFQTGLFAEGYPAEIGSVLLIFAQVAYVASIVLAIVTSAVFLVGYGVKMAKDNKALFLWSTYVFMLLSFMLYMIKYPYTCSGDFRYMAATLVFTSIGFVLVSKKKGLKLVVCVLMCVTIVGSDALYLAGAI